MPEVISYTVKLTREVKVEANNLEDAQRLALAAFRAEGATEAIMKEYGSFRWGRIVGRVRDRELTIDRTSA